MSENENLELILNEIVSLKELLKKEPHKEWVSISQAEKILGISRERINEAIHNAKLPFEKNGSRYILNLDLARQYFCKENIANMERVKKAIDSMPLSRKKVTKNIGSNTSKSTPKVRRQMV